MTAHLIGLAVLGFGLVVFASVRSFRQPPPEIKMQETGTDERGWQHLEIVNVRRRDWVSLVLGVLGGLVGLASALLGLLAG